ncbi:MAG TPA: hypothetical protein VMM13_19635, partial [Euzebya sp.]|nr:hypothetical protein [Euzebya sp.]
MSHEIDSDLDDVDRALADDREDLALEVLRGHIARLEAFAEGVRRTVAGSMAERDAEAVVDAVVATMPTPPAPRLTPPAPRLTPPAPRLTPPAPRLT